MKKLTLLLFGLFFITGALSAQNVLWVDTVSSYHNQNVQFSVKTSNVNTFVAFQLDIEIPSAASYVENSMQLTGRDTSHLMAVSFVNANTLRVIVYSFNLQPVTGNSGKILRFELKTKTKPGDFVVKVLNAVLSNASNVNIITGFFNGRLTVLTPDINTNLDSLDFGRVALLQQSNVNLNISNQGNLPLNVSGLSTTNPEIFFPDSLSFVVNPGSMVSKTMRFKPNTSGNKNALLKIFSNDPDDSIKFVKAKGIAYSVNELRVGNIAARSGYFYDLYISINNMDKFTAFQFSITLPNEMKFVQGSASLISSRIADHVITADTVSGNKLNVVALSPSNKPFTGNEGNIAKFTFFISGQGGSYSLMPTNSIISDSAGVNLISASYNGNLNIASPYINVQNSLSFGNVSFLDTGRALLNISNSGNDTLIINNATFSDGSFKNITSLPLRIPEGQSAVLSLTFRNQNKGNYSSQLTIYNNDAPRNPKYVSLSANVYIPNKINVTSQLSKPYDTLYIPFNIRNYERFVAFQFDVTLPADVIYQPNSALLTSRAQGHTVTASILGNGKIRIIAFSMTQAPFLNDTGDVVKIKVALNANSGVLPVTLSDVIISDSLNINIAAGFTNGQISILDTPHLLIPLNLSTGIPLSIDLIWSKPIYSEKYNVVLATDTGFANIIFNDSTLTDSIKAVSGLTPLTTYYWKVRARYSAGWGQFSQVWKFTTIEYYTRTVNVTNEWNIISVPLVSSSMIVDSLFLGAISQAFGYNNGYVQTTTLSNAKGYWLKFGSSGSYNVFGLLYSPQNIPLVAGWNLIGPFDNNITVANIVTNPPGIITSLFFGYNNGYQSSTTLNPGKGYWVKTTQAGTIILSSDLDNTQIVQQNNKQENSDNSKSSWTRIRITDAKNNNTLLYLAKSNEITSSYELPPVPPQGIFDARFESNYLVEASGKNHGVKITSAEYPIQISAESLNGMNLRLRDKVTGKIINEELTEGKIITVYQPIETFDIIDDNALPTTYNLEQNYPNPFNSMTKINYSLPQNNKVTIKLYDMLGREVRTLVNTTQEVGYYTINFSASDLASGLYFVRMQSGSFVDIKKIMLVK